MHATSVQFKNQTIRYKFNLAYKVGTVQCILYKDGMRSYFIVLFTYTVESQ